MRGIVGTDPLRRDGAKVLRPGIGRFAPSMAQRVNISNGPGLSSECSIGKGRGISGLARFSAGGLIGHLGSGSHCLGLFLVTPAAGPGRGHGAVVLRPGVGHFAPVMAQSRDHDTFLLLDLEGLIGEIGGDDLLGAVVLAVRCQGDLLCNTDRLGLLMRGIVGADPLRRDGAVVLRPGIGRFAPGMAQSIGISNSPGLSSKSNISKFHGIRSFARFSAGGLFGELAHCRDRFRFHMAVIAGADTRRCHGAIILRPGVDRLTPVVAKGGNILFSLALCSKSRVLKSEARVGGLAHLRASGRPGDLTGHTDRLGLNMFRIPGTGMARGDSAVVLRPDISDFTPGMSQGIDHILSCEHFAAGLAVAACRQAGLSAGRLHRVIIYNAPVGVKAHRIIVGQRILMGDRAAQRHCDRRRRL